jgi:hypothetical protein
MKNEVPTAVENLVRYALYSKVGGAIYGNVYPRPGYQKGFDDLGPTASYAWAVYFEQGQWPGYDPTKQ